MSKILFIGDSITDAGRNKTNGSVVSMGQGYALMVSSELAYQNPGKYEFVNTGISGNRIVDVYSRIKVDCWNHNPDVLSILIGVNDVWHEFGSQNGVDAERFEKMYRILIEDTKKAVNGIKIVILEPFVLCGEGTEEHYDEFRKEVEKRAEIARKIAEEYNLTFIPLQAAFDEAAQNSSPELWLRDGVHPTPAGHRLITEKWLNAFKTL